MSNISTIIDTMQNNEFKSQEGGKKTKALVKEKKVKENIKTDLSNNFIGIDDIYKFSDLFFKQKNIMYTHLYNSADKLLDEDIPNFLNNTSSVFEERVDIQKNKIYRYKFKFENISVKPPFIDMDDKIMYPSDARLRNLTYASKIVATITQIQETIDIAT